MATTTKLQVYGIETHGYTRGYCCVMVLFLCNVHIWTQLTFSERHTHTVNVNGNTLPIN